MADDPVEAAAKVVYKYVSATPPLSKNELDLATEQARSVAEQMLEASGYPQRVKRLEAELVRVGDTFEARRVRGLEQVTRLREANALLRAMVEELKAVAVGRDTDG